MGELHFSRCTETPWTWDIPYICPGTGGTYRVLGPSRGDAANGQVVTAGEAVAMVAERLPARCGKAFLGTPEELAAHEAARAQKRPPRSVNITMIVFSVFLGVLTIIGLSFLAGGLAYSGGPVIRTTATVIAVRQVTDLHMAHSQHTEFTLRFTDQDHQVVTVDTDQVKETPPVAQGDRIQVYVPADPSDVTDVRYGPPGAYDYEMGAAFLGIAVAGWTVIVIMWARKRQPMRC